MFAEVSSSSCASSRAAEELLTAHGGNTRAESSERNRREDDENESEECSKVGKSGRSLARMLFRNSNKLARSACNSEMFSFAAIISLSFC